MKRFVVLGLLVIFCFFGKNIYAADASHTYVDIFDSFCLQNSDNFSQIDKMAKALNLTPVPKDMQEGDSVLARKKGNAYLMLKNGNAFMVAYAKNGGCTVDMRNGDVNNVRKILLKNYKIKKFALQNEGMQTTEMYGFTDDSLYRGGMLSLTFEKEGAGHRMIALSYLPRRIVPPKVALEIAASLSTSKTNKKVSLLDIFNTVCLKNKGDVSEMKKTLKEYGFFDVPGSIAQGFPITHSHNGKIYALHNDNKIYLAGINDDGICEIMAKNTDIDKIKECVEQKFHAKFIKDVFNKGFVNKFYQIDTIGEKTKTIFIVRYLPDSNPNELLIKYVPHSFNSEILQMLSSYQS